MTFRSTTLAFIIIFLDVILSIYFFGISVWWIVLPIIIYKAFIIYGSANIQSSFFVKTYCNSNTSEKLIAITFDDGPNAEYTAKVLLMLSKYNAPATFFVIGKKIKGNENLLKQMDKAGHTIGNHTFSHSLFVDFKRVPAFIYELDATSDTVYNIIGKRMKLFRPPYGVTTPNISKAVKALKYYTIGWNIRSMDTTRDSIETIVKRVQTQLKPGAIILFHDTSDKTIEVLKQTLNFVKENDFKIVSVEELLKIKGYE